MKRGYHAFQAGNESRYCRPGVQPGLISADAMLQVLVLVRTTFIFVQEITDGLCQWLAGVFKNVMPAVRIAEHFGAWENAFPLVQEMQIKDKVFLSPCKQAGFVGENPVNVIQCFG